jgi:hypothetical protein
MTATMKAVQAGLFVRISLRALLTQKNIIVKLTYCQSHGFRERHFSVSGRLSTKT